MLKLYHTAPSVCSIKVRLGLAEIGLDYTSETLDFATSEQHGAAYLRLNPDGVVPTLIDDDLVVVESSLILDYLDRTHNNGALTPTDRVASTKAAQWLLRTLAIHAAINTLTFSTANRDQILAKKTQAEIAAAIAKMPDPGAQLKRADLLKNGLASPYVEQAFGQLQRCFADMDQALSAQYWITGPAFGIADIALLSYIDRLERLGFAGLWAATPRIGAWLARMQARPSYDTAIKSQISEAATKSTREGGAAHWPEVSRLWAAYLQSRP